LVFVTSEKFVGNTLMGLVGADNACNDLAEAAGLYAGGIAVEPMRAWLSGTDFDAGTRILFGEGRYVRRDGKVVVGSAAELVSGHLQAAIEIDEWGELVNAAVWTNTRADGTAISKVETCGNWSSNDEPAVSHVGGSPATDLSWTHAQAGINPQSCELDFRLYCFEERGTP
jgi:hypothetical protein